MSWEPELFNLGNVIVTDKRLSIGKQQFSMETIRNAEVIYRSRTWTPVMALLLTAGTFEISGLSLAKPLLQMAAVGFLMLTATLFWKGGPRYSIGLTTREGYLKPLTSADRFFVESVGQVLQRTLGLAQGRGMTRREGGLELSPARSQGFQVVPGKQQAAASAAGQATPMRASYQMSQQTTIHPRVFTMNGSSSRSRRAV